MGTHIVWVGHCLGALESGYEIPVPEGGRKARCWRPTAFALCLLESGRISWCLWSCIINE